MVPLFKSVGYQLICHTFFQKSVSISNSNLDSVSWNRKKNPQHPPSRMCRFPAYKHVLAP